MERRALLVLTVQQGLTSPTDGAQDPPTPWLTWVMAQWNARLIKIYSTPAPPAAAAVERRVMEWLAPALG